MFANDKAGMLVVDSDPVDRSFLELWPGSADKSGHELLKRPVGKSGKERAKKKLRKRTCVDR